MSQPLPNSWLRNGWTLWHALGAALMAGLGVLATFDAWRDIYHIAARDEESSQVYVVPVVLAWLLWVRRRRLRQCRPRGLYIGPAIAALGWLLYWVGDLRLIQSFWHGGAVLVAVGCLFSVLGSDVLKQFLPALATLVFLVPVPGRIRQHVAIPLGAITAQITQQLFLLMGVAVERSGNLLSINKVDVTIAEACNGLRMVFSLVMVCFAFAFGTPLRWYSRLLVLVASPVAAVVCNIIRLVPTLYLYGHISRTRADWFHDTAGWIMLPIAFLMLMGILRLLRWALVPVTEFTLAYD